jgi:hypothetical protein
MITIEPQVFYGVIGSAITMLATAIAVWVRSNASSREYREKSQADGYTKQENVKAAANDALIDIAKQGVVFQQKMIEVVQENTRANEKSSAEMRGMVTMMDGFGTVLKNAVIGWDDTQGQIPAIRENTAQIPGIRDNVQAIQTVTATLETDIGETVGIQIGVQVKPIVDALLGVEIEVKNLVRDSQERDARTNTSLLELVAGIEKARTEFMRMLEPIVIKHMTEFLPADKPIVNGIEKGVTSEEPETPKP